MRRVRAEVGGLVLLDSDGVQALHRTGEMMALYVPSEDVHTAQLTRGATSSEPGIGELT